MKLDDKYYKTLLFFASKAIYQDWGSVHKSNVNILLGSSTSYHILDYSFSKLYYLSAIDSYLIIKRYKLL